MTLPKRRADLDGLATYSSVRPGRAPILVRASSNEAPGPLDPAIAAAVGQALARAGRYPVLGGQDLIDRLAVELGLPAETVAVGDGSLSLLDRTLWAFLRPGDEVVMGWRSYEAYPMSVQVAGGRPVQVPLDFDGCHDLAAMLSAVTERTRVVIVCNPNNPTGTTVEWARLIAFLDALPAHILVVLDEAYTEYDDRSRDPQARLSALVARGNVLVLRTFSKAYGLAGLRVGYLASSPDVVAAVRSVLAPFPVSIAGVAGAIAALEHREVMHGRVKDTRVQRDAIIRLLGEHKLHAPESRANFVWLPLAERSTAFDDLCLANGLAVRPFPGEGVRVTVGDPGLPSLLERILSSWATDPILNPAS